MSSNENEFNDQDDEDENMDLTPGKTRTKVVFQPTADSTHTIFWRGHWLRVKRGKKLDQYGSNVEILSIRCGLIIIYPPLASCDQCSFPFIPS